MQAIILAGGFGTRIREVVKDVPKPMAEISGKPFLHYLLSDLRNQGFTNVVISVGYLKEKIIEYFGDNYLGLKISYAPENEPLGTGGAILNSLEFIDKAKPAVVLNGDSFLQVDYSKLLKFHEEKKSNLSIVLRKMDDCSRYGQVALDGDKIIQFEEKNAEQKSGLINGGIYIVNTSIFENLDLPKSFSFEKNVMMKYLSKIQSQGFVVDGYFIDIGIPEDYKKAQNELPKIIKNKALFLDRDGVINHDYGYVHKIEDFHFIDGIFELCKKYQEQGYLIIVATNQAGIARGFYDEEQFFKLTAWMENEFAKQGIKITKTFYCPYHIDGKVEKYRQDSFDRKPNPGMLLKAIEEFNIDPEKSVMFGDRESDRLAAKSAKIKITELVNCKNLKNFSF